MANYKSDSGQQTTDKRLASLKEGRNAWVCSLWSVVFGLIESCLSVDQTKMRE